MATEKQTVPSGYRPLGRLSTAVQCLFAGWVALDILEIVFRFMERSLMHRVLDNPLSVSYADLTASDDRLNAVRVILIAGFILTVILFIAWFHRAYRNLEPLGQQQRYSPGWAIGGWFVPIGNWFIVKKEVNDIWRGTSPVGSPTPPGTLLVDV